MSASAVPMSVTIGFDDLQRSRTRDFDDLGRSRTSGTDKQQQVQTGSCLKCPNPLPPVKQTGFREDPNLCQPCNRVAARH